MTNIGITSFKITRSKYSFIDKPAILFKIISLKVQAKISNTTEPINTEYGGSSNFNNQN